MSIIKSFLEQAAFDRYCEHFHDRYSTLDAQVEDNAYTLVDRAVLTPPNREERLANCFHELLRQNERFVLESKESKKIFFLMQTLSPYNAQISEVYFRAIEHLQEQNRQLKKALNDQQHLRQQFPLPIVDTSDGCIADTNLFLQGDRKDWSPQQILDMCAFLHFRAMSDQALQLFACCLIPHMIDNVEQFSPAIAEFLGMNALPLDGSALSALNHGVVFYELLQTCIFQNPSLLNAIPENICQWMLQNTQNARLQNARLLGHYHWVGLGVPKDDAKALENFQKAAALGDAGAYISIGNCYWLGRGVPQDDAEMLTNYQKAADLGIADAYVNIGNCYWEGRGVPKDDAKALTNYQKAADLGNATAYLSIGNCYRTGRGVPKDDAEALKNFQKAAALGDARAYREIGKCYWFGRGAPQDDAKALKNFQKAAALGDAEAYRRIGDCYLDGRGVPQDEAEALTKYQKAADLGDAEAYRDIGDCYWFGQGVHRDDAKAFTNYQKAAALGDAEAHHKIGHCYWFGRGVPRDESQAIRHWTLGVQGGDSHSKYNLAQAFVLGSRKDYPKARQLLQELISANYPGAGQFYQAHLNVLRNA